MTQALAQDSFKIGLVLPLTGPFASTGKQIEATVAIGVVAAHRYVNQEFETVKDVKDPGRAK